jgi:response regulator RpfG family c-di-GMP phosphodiesterase
VDFVTKPFKPLLVKARIAAHLKLKEQRDELSKKNAALEAAMAQVKALSGLLPICMMCKKIRDDQGYWNQLEAYISKHTDAVFSHGICPECAEKYGAEIKKLSKNRG